MCSLKCGLLRHRLRRGLAYFRRRLGAGHGIDDDIRQAECRCASFRHGVRTCITEAKGGVRGRRRRPMPSVCVETGKVCR